MIDQSVAIEMAQPGEAQEIAAFVTASSAGSEGGPVRYAVIGEAGPWVVTFTIGDDDELYVPPLYQTMGANARVVLVQWPDVRRLHAAVEAAVTAMDAAGARKAVWYGTSVSGAIAQAANIYAPDRVRGMILSNTALPVSWAQGLVGFANLLVGLVPERMLRARLARTAGAADQSVQGQKAVAMLGKTDIQNWLRWAADFHGLKIGRMSNEDRAKPVLIIETDNDPGVPKAQREKLKAFYAHADVVAFPGGGHFPHLSFPDEYESAVGRFLHQFED